MLKYLEQVLLQTPIGFQGSLEALGGDKAKIALMVYVRIGEDSCHGREVMGSHSRYREPRVVDRAPRQGLVAGIAFEQDHLARQYVAGREPVANPGPDIAQVFADDERLGALTLQGNDAK